MKPNLKCSICQKPIYRIPSRQNGHNVCSYACRNRYYSKEKSFAYKHGKCIMDKNGKTGRNAERDRTRDKLRKISFKVKAIEYLGGKCQVCGYNKCIASLDFHHRNPKLKNKNIKDISNNTWKTVQNELDKCILLCCNCHRELHWEKSHGQEFRREVDEYLSTYVPRKVQVN